MPSDKAAHLLSYVDLARPELAAATSAEAFVAHLARPPRPRYIFEYERKPEMLAFLREHYESWRKFDTSSADRVVAMTIEQAKAARALVGVPALGKAWWAIGDAKYGAAFQRFYIESETGDMFNWDSFNGSQSCYELAAWFLLQDCDGLTTEGRIAFLDHLHAICDNAWDVHTSTWPQIGLGPEGHNWYLHGMHSLPFVGLLFPEFKRSEFFVKTGWSVVEEHVRGHYRADGGARETSMGYQAGSMHCLWDLYLIAARNSWPVSARFVDRLLNATMFLLRLMSPQGGTPSFGDGGHSPGGLTDLAATAAAITGDRECKWFAEYCRAQGPKGRAETPGEIPEGAFWCVGLEGARAYAQTRPRNPNHVSVLMGPTGYAALRDSDRPDAAYLAIAAADRGPIVTSHGHNEIFSLDVHAGGVRFIGEMGCAPYGNSPGRDYDQKTEGHTCLTIEGMEQAPIVNEWRWDAVVLPAVRRWVSEPDYDFFHGVHEGFYRWSKHQTLHARKVFFMKSGRPAYWVVLDWVESNVENDYRAYFHGCVPGRVSGKSIVLGKPGATRLAVIPPARDDVALSQVKSEGWAAYVKEKQLDPRSYPCFVYGKRAVSDCFVWVLAPAAPGEGFPKVKRLAVRVNGAQEEPHGATAVEVAFDDHTDVLCVSHKDFDATLEFGAFDAWGNLAFRRIGGKGDVVLAIEQTMADGGCGR